MTIDMHAKVANTPVVVASAYCSRRNMATPVVEDFHDRLLRSAPVSTGPVSGAAPPRAEQHGGAGGVSGRVGGVGVHGHATDRVDSLRGRDGSVEDVLELVVPAVPAASGLVRAFVEDARGGEAAKCLVDLGP